MSHMHCAAPGVGWHNIPIGAFFAVVHTGPYTEKTVGRMYRKVSAEAAVDTEDQGDPPLHIFFEPSDKGYCIVNANIGTDYAEARELTAHKVNGLNEALRIFVLDYAGHGGASHEYTILVPCDHDDTVAWAEELQEWCKWRIMCVTADVLLHVAPRRDRAVIQRTVAKQGSKKPTVCLEFFDAVSLAFQNGPIKEAGVNGISQEALIAVLLDRLEGFQSGQYKCHDNQLALDHLQSARLWLHKRTMDRVARQVEGTMAK